MAQSEREIVQATTAHLQLYALQDQVEAFALTATLSI